MLALFVLVGNQRLQSSNVFSRNHTAKNDGVGIPSQVLVPGKLDWGKNDIIGQGKPLITNIANKKRFTSLLF